MHEGDAARGLRPVQAAARPGGGRVGSRENGHAQLVVNFDKSLEARGVHAGDVVREAAALIGGGGGGRPTMARAGGKQPEGLAEALAAAERADRRRALR